MTALPQTSSRQRHRPAAAVRAVRIGRASWRLPLRSAGVCVASAAVLVLLVGVDLAYGEVDIPLMDVARVLTGGGELGQRFIVTEVRLPQAAVAVLVGMALGMSGALTQTFARNPLASPDILGVTQGAAAAAVAVLVLGGASGYGGALVGGRLQEIGLPIAAFLGGLLTALALYLLSWQRGIDGQRFVLVGIGIGAVLQAVTSWLLVHAQIQDAASAQLWLNGSLSSRGWEQARPVLVTVLVLAPLSFALVRHLNALQLGDDAARGLGVRLQTTQLLTLVAAVGLAAVAVAAVGPLAFVAFVVPQIGVRLTGGSRPPLLASMLLGGCLVVGADVVTRVVLPFAIPAGLVTAFVGAPYLLYLVHRTRRRESA